MRGMANPKTDTFLTCSGCGRTSSKCIVPKTDPNMYYCNACICGAHVVGAVECCQLRRGHDGGHSAQHEQRQDLAVKVGQVWADSDKRSAGRRVRVVEVDATHATVELVDQRGRPARWHEAQQKAQPGRRTRIRLDRFRPTSSGYRLVAGADGTEVAS